MFDWFKVVKEPIEVKELEEDVNDKWMEEEVMKEERLSRMLERKRLWEVGFMWKGVLDEVMENVARSEMENEVEKMIEEVLGAGMKESMI